MSEKPMSALLKKWAFVVGNQTDTTKPPALTPAPAPFPPPQQPSNVPQISAGPSNGAPAVPKATLPPPATTPAPAAAPAPASLPPTLTQPQPTQAPTTPMTSVPSPSLAPPQPTKTVPTTESPNTPVSTSMPAQTVVTGGSAPQGNHAPAPPSPVQYDELTSHLSDSNIPVEQRQQFGQKFLQDTVNANKDLVRGFRDIQSGNANTPEAQKYQAQLKTSKDEFVRQHVQQAVQNNPEATQNPQTFGQLASQAANDAMQKFQSMSMPMQLMMGIGLPMGLIGVMSSLFGEGGAGMGLMGALGLGAAGLAASGGGMFGQDAQNFTTDRLLDAGQFFGAIPSEKQDLSFLLAEDPAKALEAQHSGGAYSPAAIKAKLEDAAQKKQQLGMFMNLPEGMRSRMLQRLDANITPENSGKAVQNAALLHDQLNDPNSRLNTLQQRAQGIVDNPWTGYLKAIGGSLADRFKFGHDARAVSSPNVLYLIGKWAEKQSFNDMDAKELNDLKTQSSRGVSYRVEDAVRLNNLQKRQQAEQPMSKATVTAACQKAARCWAGYEPVPGKKPYSNDSCRPAGSKKKKKDTKKK